jgi:hypothetical protein
MRFHLGSSVLAKGKPSLTVGELLDTPHRLHTGIFRASGRSIGSLRRAAGRTAKPLKNPLNVTETLAHTTHTRLLLRRGVYLRGSVQLLHHILYLLYHRRSEPSRLLRLAHLTHLTRLLLTLIHRKLFYLLVLTLWACVLERKLRFWTHLVKLLRESLPRAIERLQAPNRLETYTTQLLLTRLVCEGIKISWYLRHLGRLLPHRVKGTQVHRGLLRLAHLRHLTHLGLRLHRVKGTQVHRRLLRLAHLPHTTQWLLLAHTQKRLTDHLTYPS